MSIPRKIFQTWKSREVVIPMIKLWQESWKSLNPDYEYTIWDDTDNLIFVEKHFPDFLKVYSSYEKNICRVDAVRYLYLQKYGGIYADLDFQCLKSFEPLLQSIEEKNADVALGMLSEMDNEIYNVHRIPNALMISRPNTEFWDFVIHALGRSKKYDLPPETQTGPVFLNMCFEIYRGTPYDSDDVEKIYGVDIFKGYDIKNQSAIIIAEPDTFYPINWGREDCAKYYKSVSYDVCADPEQCREVFPNSYAVTYWMHSW